MSFSQTKNDCKTIKATSVPGYSSAGSNRFFHHGDFINSFLFTEHGFKVFIGGPGDTYTWDSVQKCSNIYRIYFTNSGAQEKINPPISILKIDEHHVSFETQVGILRGAYDLAFDLTKNEKTKSIPVEELGKWQIRGGGLLVIREDRTLDYGVTATSPVTKYKIDQIRIDRVANSTRYDLTLLNGQNGPGPETTNIVVMHGDNRTMILVGSDYNLVVPQQIDKIK